ncbi:MAG TPA: hypothetical protein VLG09_00340, partial [Candidatus Saccharimonadales bacterium]|nr:hypothetical protein [Candidatus Saccharimonadales bacterium]
MDQNQFPTEPSTTRPVAIEPVVDTTRYVKRLRRVSIIAYVLPLLALVIPFLYLGGLPSDGWGLIIFIALFGAILAVLLHVFILTSEVILLVMTIRYLVKGWLVGRARTVAIVSLCLYT